jgi:glutathione S-transferase
MPEYKLTYFDFAASRGEECRLALHVAGVEFEDERLTREAWASRKPNTPYGSLPVLTVEGKGELAQSNAILSFVGHNHGMLPADPFEAARHEAVLLAVEDLRAVLNPTGRIADPAAKQAAREAFATDVLPPWAAWVDKQIASEGPFFGGANISVADLKLFIIVRSIKDGTIDHVPATSFAPFERLERLYEAVRTHPAVAEWTGRFAR